jgi:hypothetical protein
MENSVFVDKIVTKKAQIKAKTSPSAHRETARGDDKK